MRYTQGICMRNYVVYIYAQLLSIAGVLSFPSTALDREIFSWRIPSCAEFAYWAPGGAAAVPKILETWEDTKLY